MRLNLVEQSHSSGGPYTLTTATLVVLGMKFQGPVSRNPNKRPEN